MKISDERQILPIIREAVTNHELMLSRFMEDISPLYENFIAAGLERDEYRGYAFDLVFINAALADCVPYRSAISSADTTWKFFSEGKDDCTYVIPGRGLIKIHLHSFLWMGQ